MDKEIKYNEWEDIELENVPFCRYKLENGDQLIYSMNEYGLLDLATIYLKESNTMRHYEEDEMSVVNMIFIASGEDIEMIRSLIKLDYKAMLDGDYSYLRGMIE